MHILLFAGLLCLPAISAQSADEDEIEHLPDVQFLVPFKHYSGFLKTSDTRFLHYWFVESQLDPAADPIIFWFNGGPGCSSLGGLLYAMGPYVFSPEADTLKRNENAWNKIANVVYLESPVGVGFSYSTGGNITTDDDLTAEENYLAVKAWFERFPTFRPNPTFIAGESYGGIFVPTLAKRIIDGQKDFKINLQGIAIGNGLVSRKLNDDTLPKYAHVHGFIDDQSWNSLKEQCCDSCMESCLLSQFTGNCDKSLEDAISQIPPELNWYDIYRNCERDPTSTMDIMIEGVAPRLYRVMETEMKSRMRMKSSGNQSMLMGPQCFNTSDIVSYLNNVHVRKALHIPSSFTQQWDVCRDHSYRAKSYKRVHHDMAPFVKKIVQAGVRVLLFYGDTDLVCNFMMGEKFADQLGIKRIEGKAPWKFDEQIGGFQTLYEGLTFLTVRGAGHMAAQWKAPQMNYVIKQFISNKPI